MMMKTRYYHRLLKLALCVGCWLLVTACSNDVASDGQEPLPEGMGRIRLTITAPETASSTRAVRQPNAWEDPDHDWETLHTFRILICDENNVVVQIIEGSKDDIDWTEETHTGEGNVETNSASSTHKKSAVVISQPLDEGNYYIFATANFADGYEVGSPIEPNRTIKLTNGLDRGNVVPGSEVTSNIPMTGKLMENGALKSVSVSNGSETDAGILSLWRVMAKLQFEFTNETGDEMKILGIEVEPINQASTEGSGIYLFSKDNLESEANLVPLFPANATKTVSVTWPLNTATLQTTASVSMGGVFAATELSLDGGENSKLNATGLCTAGVASLYKFAVKEDIGPSRDNAAVITFKVTLATGMNFIPKNLSFKACRGVTDAGNFDVAVVVDGTSTDLAMCIKPERYDVSPFFSMYSYPLSVSATTGDVVVKIYVYNLTSGEDYAFGDVTISGDITNNTGSALQEHITLPAGSSTDVGSVTYTPSSALTLGANASGNLYFYVNETDASFTTAENQLSLRFKIQRGSYTEELRYGVTTPYTDGTTGGNGFNVIRRNDWIHIPIHLTDWQFRVEPLAFVPIAGYPAKTLSSDGLTATFSTGGMIALQPFIKKYDDPTWRDFDDPDITLVDIHWKNDDGTDVYGDNNIVKSAFAYDQYSRNIIGELNNKLPTTYTKSSYMTTFTVHVKLAYTSGSTTSQYDYTFTFNVVLEK
ncbi:MAG: FimB/Mfa2 family fimbrial subunit [Prevotella sp.]|nr:FimB/Mfa2 family fimbrial subunit [Prevotella sp.]